MKKRRYVSGVRAGQQVMQGPHEHTCVNEECGREYECVNACDPRGLNDSPCPQCYAALADPENDEAEECS